MLPTGNSAVNSNKPAGTSDNDPAGFNKRRLAKPDSQTSSKLATSSSGSNLLKHGGHHHGHHHLHIPQPESKLFSMISIELKDPLEITLEESYAKLQHLINESSAFNDLSQYASQSKVHNDELSNALLYSLLTEPGNASKCLRNIFLCNNLSFNFSSNQQSDPSNVPYACLIGNLINLISETYSKLLDTPRQQLLWLIKELTRARVNQFDKLLLQMLRNIQSGCLSDKNIWLAESILDIFTDQTTTNQNQDQSNQGLWIYQFGELMSQTVYTYLRIISDHAQSSTLQQLRQRETDFCIQILREKWNECMLIGRDLVRLLQNIARIPEFEALWKDIIQSPNLLSPHFAQLGGLLYLMRLPTKRRCLISRLTLDMERKIYFIITQVKAGAQKKYLEWFLRQYLNTPESQSLRVDIMRYICVVVHPTNEQLNAGLTPRWALCSWLLNTCTSPLDSANLKLALYYDWLMYDAKKENIMLIEPAILLMFNLIRLNNIPGLTLSMLFDFLCRIAVNYHVPFREHILNGLMQSFKDSVEKRVIPSMQIFFGTTPDPKTQQQVPCLDRDLKNLIQATFGNFFQTLNLKPVDLLSLPLSPSPTPVSSNSPSPIQFKQTETKAEIIEIQTVKSEEILVPVFSSDDEDDLEVKTALVAPVTFQQQQQQQQQMLPDASTTNYLQLQIQQFTQRPFKIYTTLDDIQTVVQTLSSNTLQQNANLENQLSLIGSDDLRDKLAELNSKLKDYYQSLQSSLSSSWSTKSFLVNSLFKECLTFIYKDPEFSSNFSTLLTDLAVCLSIMFKNDFANNLLPNQFYKNEISFLDQTCYSSLNESISQRPIFILFKEISTTPNLSNEREILVQLLTELYLKQNRIGYYFLFYIYTVSLKSQPSNQSNSELNGLIRIFKEFVQERNNLTKNGLKNEQDLEKVSSTSGSVSDASEEDEEESEGGDEEEEDEKFSESDLVLANCLMQDLRLCQQDDPYLFCFLLPFVCGQDLLPNYMVNNSELIYLIVSCIDSRQLKDIVSSVISQDLELLKQPEDKKAQNSKKNSKTQAAKKTTTGLKRKRKSSETTEKPRSKGKNSKNKGKFKKETLVDVLNASLLWESIEQIFFWEILMAHDEISLNYLLPIFNRLDSNKNSEAVCYLFQMIKSAEPSFDLIKYIVQRKVEDNLTRALIVNWSKKTSDSQMSQMFIKLLNKSVNQQNNNCKSESTLKKIKYNESLTSNNKVKLTAQQQLEQNQKRGSGLYDEEDLNKMPSIDQVLAHLNKLRFHNACIGFILSENLRECLKKIYNKNLDDDLRKKYSELFTLADEFQDEENSEDEEEEEDNEEEKNSESEEERTKGRSLKARNSNKKSSANKRGKQTGGVKKTVKKQKYKASSDEEDDQDEDEEEDDEKEENEDEEQNDSADSSSDNDYSKKNKKKQKRGQNKNSNQQPPRKKPKHLKTSDNDSD